MTHAYGWIRQLPDIRDRLFDLSRVASVPLPPRVDWRGSNMPPVYDQGQLGSCSANMAAAAVDYERARQGLPFVDPSRLFVYYNERAAQHTTRSDSGATIREAYKAINAQGVCPEREWPYVISQFTKKPPKTCYTDALTDRVVQYEAVPQSLPAMQQILASGLCIGVGFSVYASFESDQVAATGMVPMPTPGEQMLGGHAVLVVGYDIPSATWIVRNSWGSGWGQAGYFQMPFAYLLNAQLASDFWAAQLVQAAS